MKSSVPGFAFRFVLLSSLLSLFAFTLEYLGQDSAPAPSVTPSISPQEARYNELKRELERAKEIAQMEADIAEARKRSQDSLPKPRSSPLSGGLAITGDDIAQDVMVYRELRRATARVANTIRQTVPSNSTIAIFNGGDLADWSFYRRSIPLFKVVVEDLTADYCLVANADQPDGRVKMAGIGGFAGTIAGTGNLVGQFADLLSYAKTDVAMFGRSVSVAEDAVVADLFSDLRRDSGFELFYPKTFSVDSPVYCGSSTMSRPCCGSGPNDCAETRQVYCSEIANLLDGLYRARRAAFAAKQVSPELKKIEVYFSEFLKLLSEPTPADTTTALKRYVNAEQVAAMQKRDNLYYLEIKSLRAVGTQRVRKNLFFLSDKLDYSGGVVLQWTLFDKDGRVRNSGIETSYDGFLKPDQLHGPRP